MLRLLLIGSAAIILGVALHFLIRGELVFYSSDEPTLTRGKKLFSTYCLSCHALQADGIGPPLGGITLVLSEKELKHFIRNPEKAMQTADERLRILQTRYKQIMPSFDWMDDPSIHSILSYIHYQSNLHQIKGLAMPENKSTAGGLSGRLVRPVKKSGLKIQLEEIIRIPRLPYSTPDLGIVTLRPHPSADGTLFVSDQGGIIYRIRNGTANVFLDLRNHIEDFSIGPGIATGLGSFDFHPDFLRNGLIYITHGEKYVGQPADYRISDSVMAEVQWVLGEWKVQDPSAGEFKGNHRELLRLHAPTFGHGAQDLAFMPDLPQSHPEYGLLYWGFGDGGSNNIRKPEMGHNPRSFLGTIMRIDPSGTNSRNGKYGIPRDNPFADDPDPLTVKEIYAFGFRNPHRIAWDASNHHRMMATDIGESNIEEINVVEKGGDYGWPYREGNFTIDTRKDLKTVYKSSPADVDLYKGPFAQYDHSDGYAISGGYVYEGQIEALRDKYIFGDIVNGKLFYVNINPSLADSTVYELSIWRDGVATDLRTMTGIKRLHLRIGYDRFAREVYIITKADGKIYRVQGVK